MNLDRRRQPRITPPAFTFLQMERDEGGRVVNISEEGLCFESFTSLGEANPVRLWFSFNLRDRLEATGQVVWADGARKFGGLVFTDLNEAARQQIRSLIAESSSEQEATGRNGSNGEMIARRSFFHANGAKIAAAPELGEVRTQAQPAGARAEASKSELAAEEGSDLPGHTQLVPLERFVSATRSQFLRGLLLGILIPTAIGIPLFRSMMHSRPGGGGSEMPEQNSQVNPGGQSDAQSGKCVCDPTSLTAVPPAPLKSQSSTKASDSPANLPAPGLRKNSSGSSSSQQNAGGASLAQVSANQSSSKKSTATPDQLWEAVQAGNAKAAVTLADLYLRGDGVPANCAQAKILLGFASQKKNVEATRRAQQLEKDGCPAP